jgi:hypothetical protein
MVTVELTNIDNHLALPNNLQYIFQTYARLLLQRDRLVGPRVLINSVPSSGEPTANAGKSRM